MRLENEKLIAHNRSVHNIVAGEYEERHSDIYNDIERARMDRVLAGTIVKLRTGNATPLVLDYGAGTGNLTDHLLRAGARVVSADVSEGMLGQIRAKFGNSGRCEAMLLNGLDLSNFS
ncbi:MAG TPA: methyltransferase domain-containing protein, partial [Candidatus Kapabacteria bacterium]|nr:methyltransferase domain-containing protein [Candidatus Kapabacteria bacterium]